MTNSQHAQERELMRTILCFSADTAGVVLPDDMDHWQAIERATKIPNPTLAATIAAHGIEQGGVGS